MVDKDFEFKPETLRLGFDLLNALTEEVVAMQRRWNRKKIDWKISPEGTEMEARMADIEQLCDGLEGLLPVLTTPPVDSARPADPRRSP